MKKKDIKVSQLTSKYVTEEHIRTIGCFMQGCKGRSLYVKFSDIGNGTVYHCKFHSTNEHKRIIF